MKELAIEWALRLEAIAVAIRLEAIASSLEAIASRFGGHRSQGWRPSLQY